MKFRHWWTSCAFLIGLTSGVSAVAATVEDQSPKPPQSANGSTCQRANDQELAEIQDILNNIDTKLGSISDQPSADAGRVATKSIRLALESGCPDAIAQGFTNLRDQSLGNSEAAYQIWKGANRALATIALYQFAPDRVEAIAIAVGQDITGRWQHSPDEAADLYFFTIEAYILVGGANKNPKFLDRGLAIARERILPLADKQASPSIWFQVHLLIGDLLVGKTNMLEPGETLGDLAKQSIAASETALQVDLPDEMRIFIVRTNLAAAYAIASSSANFADQSLNDRAVAAIGKVLSDPKLTPDKSQWGYLHDAYARAVMSPAFQMQNPERGRRVKDGLAVVEQGLAKMDRNRNISVWVRLQFDRAIAGRQLAIDQRDKAEAMRNLDLAITSYEAILTVRDQLTYSGAKEFIASTQASYREVQAIKAQLASGAAQPARSKP